MESDMSGGHRPPKFMTKSSANLRRSYRLIALEGISGSGKTAVSKAVERLLNGRLTALRTRLSIQAERVFCDMMDAVPGRQNNDLDLSSEAIKIFVSIVDAALQFRYFSDRYNQHDILVFDGWLPTYYVSCVDAARADARIHRILADQDWPGIAWYRKLMDAIPAPDLIFYLKTDPRAAALRAAHRGNAAADALSRPDLLADLTRLDARYREAMSIWPGCIVDGNAPLPQVVDIVFDRIGDLLRPNMVSASTSAHITCQALSTDRAWLARRRSAQYPTPPCAHGSG